MKKILTREEQAQPLSATKKILVAYFSRSGNTRVFANQIHESVGGDIFEIVTVGPYPSDYDEVVKQARQELEETDLNWKQKLRTWNRTKWFSSAILTGGVRYPCRLQRFCRNTIFPEKPLYRFARTREAVWGEPLRISPSFARGQPFWMVLQSGAET